MTELDKRGGVKMFSIFHLLVLVPGSWQMTENYVTYEVGGAESTVIISAGHGGTLKTDDTGITERPTHGCYDVSNKECIYKESMPDCNDDKCEVLKKSDSKTAELAADIVDQIQSALGGNDSVRPYFIKALAHRSSVDLNRPKPEATFGDADAIEVWKQYHQFIDDAKVGATAGGRRALYIDVHGIAKSTEKWTMISMNLDEGENGLNKEVLPNRLAQYSSIMQLHADSGVSMEELVRGNTSIGGLMESDEFEIVPSPQFPNPEKLDRTYFGGGYSLRRHTGWVVSGFQLEATSAIRTGTSEADKAARTELVEKLANAVAHWVQNYLQPENSL